MPDIARAQADADRQFGLLHMGANGRGQGAVLLRTLLAATARNGAVLEALRIQPAPPEVESAADFATSGLEATIRGSYRGTLGVLADVARAPLVVRAQRVALQRVRGDEPPGLVRATLSFTIYRLTNTSKGK
jgi:hypothetical protein